MPHQEHDPSLRRLVRYSALMCAAATLAALVLQRGRPEGALGILVGAGLMAFSYRVIRQGVDARASRARARTGAGESGTSRGLMSHAWTLTKYVTRYGVLAVVVWVALVPLHASPVGLFLGVSIPVLALCVEAARFRKAVPPK